MTEMNLLALLLPIAFWFGARRYPRSALIAMPIVCAILILEGMLWESYSAVLSSLLILLVTPLTVLFVQRDNRPWYATTLQPSLLTFLFGIVLVLLFLTLLVVLTILEWGELAVSLLFVAGLGLLVVVLYRRSHQRYSVACNVLSTLGACIQQKLPLAPATDMAADAYRGYSARVLRRIHRGLSAGATLTEAVTRGYPQCPPYALASITAAEPINQLEAAFDSIRADIQEAYTSHHNYSPGYVYPILVFFITSFLGLGIVTFIIPQFKAVLEEMMGVGHLPRTTTIMLAIASRIAHVDGSGGFLLLLLLVLFFLGLFLRHRPRRPRRPFIGSRIGDLIRWCLPGFHWFELTRSQLHTTEHLRLCLQAGCPVNEAINQAKDHDVNYCYRRRLDRWRRRVEAGGNIAQSAKQSRVGRALVWACNQNLHTGATPEALQVLETHYRIVYRHRHEILQSILIPISILSIASFVGFMAYAFFAPAIQIINVLVDLYP